MKIENNQVADVTPAIIARKILKVGTFKINAHGTKMGEQFIKVIMDYAISEAVDACYVTIFPKHDVDVYKRQVHFFVVLTVTRSFVDRFLLNQVLLLATENSQLRFTF